jgi:hypothetical protein
MQLTLEQQFQKRQMTDVAQNLSEAQLLANLKHANSLLKRKSVLLDSFLQTGEFVILEENDPSFAFTQVLAFREFAQYNRQQLIDGLLLTLETLMHLDNQFRQHFVGV